MDVLRGRRLRPGREADARLHLGHEEHEAGRRAEDARRAQLAGGAVLTPLGPADYFERARRDCPAFVLPGLHADAPPQTLTAAQLDSAYGAVLLRGGTEKMRDAHRALLDEDPGRDAAELDAAERDDLHPADEPEEGAVPPIPPSPEAGSATDRSRSPRAAH